MNSEHRAFADILCGCIVQAWLVCNGFLFIGGVTGAPTDATVAAVRDFQQAACIPMTGAADDATKAAMKLYSSKFRCGTVVQTGREDDDSTVKPDPAGDALCAPNADMPLKSVLDYKTFLRCNGFAYGRTFDNTLDYTYRSAIRGFQDTVHIETTGVPDASLDLVMREYGAPPDIRIRAQAPSLQPERFQLRGVWNIDDSGETTKSVADNDIALQFSLNELSEILEKGEQTGVVDSNDESTAMLKSILAHVSETKPAELGPQFCRVQPSTQTLRAQVEGLGLDSSGAAPVLSARLYEHATIDGKHRCPDLFESLEVAPAAQQQCREALSGCLGVGTQLVLQSTERVRASFYARLKSSTCPTTAGGVVQLGITVGNEVHTDEKELAAFQGDAFVTSWSPTKLAKFGERVELVLAFPELAPLAPNATTQPPVQAPTARLSARLCRGDICFWSVPLAQDLDFDFRSSCIPIELAGSGRRRRAEENGEETVKETLLRLRQEGEDMKTALQAISSRAQEVKKRVEDSKNDLEELIDDPTAYLVSEVVKPFKMLASGDYSFPTQRVNFFDFAVVPGIPIGPVFLSFGFGINGFNPVRDHP